MGSFAESVDKIARVPVRCKLGQVMEDFDDDDLERFGSLARAERFSHIASLVDVGVRLVSLHARGRCVCDDGAAGKGVSLG